MVAAGGGSPPAPSVRALLPTTLPTGLYSAINFTLVSSPTFTKTVTLVSTRWLEDGTEVRDTVSDLCVRHRPVDHYHTCVPINPAASKHFAE